MTADAETAATAPLPPRAVSAQTRLLLPFLFERRAADRAAEALAGATAGIARGLWTREPPRKLYRYRLEMTGHLDRFLFSHGEKGAVEGAYLHATGDRIKRWLGALDVDLGTRVARVGLTPSPGAEIFLTAHGAGVLSLTFDLGSDVDLDSILQLNRRLSILTRPGDRAPWLSAPWPAGSEPVAAPADEHASAIPLGDRLGRPGARFSMAELLAALLEPLRAVGISPIQESLSAYAVVALPARPRGGRRGEPALDRPLPRGARAGPLRLPAREGAGQAGGPQPLPRPPSLGGCEPPGRGPPASSPRGARRRRGHGGRGARPLLRPLPHGAPAALRHQEGRRGGHRHGGPGGRATARRSPGSAPTCWPSRWRARSPR